MTTEQKFKVGDLVRLKSGGPVMTVRGIQYAVSGGDINVVWFERDNHQQLRSCFLPVDALVAVPPDEV